MTATLSDQDADGGYRVWGLEGTNRPLKVFFFADGSGNLTHKANKEMSMHLVVDDEDGNGLYVKASRQEVEAFVTQYCKARLVE